MPANPLLELQKHGQSVWQDFIQRSQTLEGDLKKLIDEDGVRGQTSNPTYFEKAIAGSDDYDEALSALADAGKSVDEIYEALTVEDIKAATDLFRPVYDALAAADGYVSLEVSPDLAHDTEATIEEARRLFAAVDRPNVMIKVPGTPAGMPAIEQLISEGINVNVTLLFSLEAYEQAANAYIAGLERHAEGNGDDLSRIASVASFFLSRVDVLVDKRLNALIEESEDAAAQKEMRALLGKAAVAQAKLAYARFKSIFRSDRFRRLEEKGARVQRPLWASTGTKNPEYSDVMYVEPLIGPDTVNTLPPATIDAFRDHGKAGPTLEDGLEEAEAALAALGEFGIGMDDVTDQLLEDGVRIFAQSYHDLIDSIAARREAILAAKAERETAFLGEAADAVGKRLRDLDGDGFLSRLRNRDASLWSADAAIQAAIANRLGWLSVHERMAAAVPELTAFGAEVREAGFKHAVLLGMGGSSLASEVIRSMLGVADGHPDLSVLDSTDPATIRTAEKAIDVSKTLFIASSKSGTTVEVLSLLEHFWERVREADGESAGGRFIAITDEGTPLEALARERSFRRVFTNPADVGGRFSALSYFGLVPAAVIGADIGRLLERASVAAKANASAADSERAPGVWLGAVLGEMALAGRDKPTLVASPELEPFGAWLEQLLAESTGKDGKGILPIDREELADPSHYGRDRVFVRLALEGDTSPDGALEKLREAGHPVLTLRFRDAYDLGGEFLRWEIATAAAGRILSLNPFDEPNVAESKENTKRLLASQPEEAPAFEEDGVAVYAEETVGDLAATLAAFVNHARPGDYFALCAYVERSRQTWEALEAIRLDLRDRARVATALGYGPRYLHSTGQLHKGGGDNGLFLFLTSDIGEDLPVPGQQYTFGELNRAQALGDIEALRGRGRRVVRLHLSGDVKAGLKKVARALEAAAVSVAE
jgi:transaldolase/glucose-6-phosphate isomerase